MHLMLTLFYSEKKKRKREACLAILCGRRRRLLPVVCRASGTIYDKKKKSQHEGDCDANLLPWLQQRLVQSHNASAAVGGV